MKNIPILQNESDFFTSVIFVKRMRHQKFEAKKLFPLTHNANKNNNYNFMQNK